MNVDNLAYAVEQIVRTQKAAINVYAQKGKCFMKTLRFVLVSLIHMLNIQ